MPTSLTLVTPREAAAFLHLSESTLAKMRMTGMGPRYRKHGRKVVYAQSELESWSNLAVSLNTLSHQAQLERNQAIATRAAGIRVMANMELERAREEAGRE